MLRSKFTRGFTLIIPLLTERIPKQRESEKGIKSDVILLMEPRAMCLTTPARQPWTGSRHSNSMIITVKPSTDGWFVELSILLVFTAFRFFSPEPPHAYGV